MTGGGKGGSQPRVIPEFTGLQVNTSVQVIPVPIIYGSPRVTTNLIYYNGFQAKLAATSSGGGKGQGSSGKGKGGGSSANNVEYFASIMLALGEGPLGALEIIYQNQQVYTPSTYPTNGFSYFSGTSTQTPWSFVVSNWPNDARPYIDTAYLAAPNAQLDNSATVPQINIVLKGLYAGSSPLNNSTITISTGQYDTNGNPVSFIGNISLGDADADPAYVLQDLMTNPTYGAGFPSGYLDNSNLFTSTNGYTAGVGDAALSTYCQAVGLAWSIVFNNAESCNSIIDRLCKNLVVAPVWNGQVLRFVPYWDAYAASNPGWDSGNGIGLKYFQPNTGAVAAITLDQILESSGTDSDPITYTRKDPMEIYNTVRLDFKDRTNFFNDNPATVYDDSHIDAYGPRVDNLGTATEYTLASYANISATMQLRRNISVVLTYTWRMGPLWAWLEPMQIVTIPDPANLSNTIAVRIISIEDDEEENITVVAENFPAGAASPTTLPYAPSTPPNQGQMNVPPSSVYPPIIFSPTTAFLTQQGQSSPQWIFGASGGGGSAYNGVLDPNWGGCNVWISLDNISYQFIGSFSGSAVIGTLTQTLGASAGSNPDNADPLYVNLSECDGVLSSVTDTLAANGYSVCVIQDSSGYELLSFTMATLVGSYVYELTGLYRGLYGTTKRMFGAGSNFMLLGPGANYLEVPIPPSFIGKTFWLKAPSFNGFKNAVQDLSAVTAYQFTLSGPTPLPPQPPASMQSPTYRRLQRPETIIAPKKNRRPR
jgi:hypothetical protein